MKIYCILITVLILMSNKVKPYGNYDIVDEKNWDEIKIKRNGTYIYKDRGDSCWTWNTFSGNWTLNIDTLTIYENRKFVSYDDKFETKLREWSEVVEHKYKLVKGGLICVDSDLVEINSHYKKR